MDNADTKPALRVLIVDDNHDAADSLAMLLEIHSSTDEDLHSKQRYDVRVAYSGADGLKTAKEFLPDCLVSDIGMPGLDGYGLARAIRSEPTLAGVKLVALSAYSDAEHARRAEEAGFDYRLTKAGNFKELLEVLGMIDEIKELASRTRDLAEQNVSLASQTRELIQEVKDDVRELKRDVAELKQDVRELKDRKGEGPSGTKPPG